MYQHPDKISFIKPHVLRASRILWNTSGTNTIEIMKKVIANASEDYIKCENLPIDLSVSKITSRGDYERMSVLSFRNNYNYELRGIKEKKPKEFDSKVCCIMITGFMNELRYRIQTMMPTKFPENLRHVFTDIKSNDYHNIIYYGIKSLPEHQWRLGRKLGSGSYGSVYESCSDFPEIGITDTFCDYIMKIMIKPPQDDPETFSEDVIREIDIQHRVQGIGIAPTIFGYYISENHMLLF